MIEAQLNKVDINWPTTTTNTALTVETVIDTSGWEFLRFYVKVGTVTATGTLNVKLQETDNSDGTTGAGDITGAAITQIVASTKLVAIDVDLTKGARKRYIMPVAVAGTANVVSTGFYVLSRKSSGTSLGTAADLGLNELVQV